MPIGDMLFRSVDDSQINGVFPNTFNEYNRESFRIYFELKGLGSLGRKINQYTDRKLIQ